MTCLGCARPVLYDPLGNCRNQAIFCAMEAQENYETRIAFGPVKNLQYIHHAQAKALIDNKWVWLTMVGTSCFPARQDPFDPLNEWKIEDFMEALLHHADNGSK